MKKMFFVLLIMVFCVSLAACQQEATIVSYQLDDQGNLIATYSDDTTENLGNFENAALGVVDTITISDDGYYVLNGKKSDIVATKAYQVSFNTDCALNVKAVMVKEGYKVERPTLDRVGYFLVGWFCNGEEWHFNSDIVLNDMILTAVWRAKEYTVSFETNNDEKIAPITVTYGSDYSLPTLHKEGYEFLGWFYKDKKVIPSDWKIADNCNLTAKWKAKEYTITLNPNGGHVSSDKHTVTYGESFTLPVPTNSYGAFTGWYLDGERITDSKGASLAPWTYLENKKLTTSWIEEISTAEQFLKIKDALNGHYKLVADIDFSTVEWSPIGSVESPFIGVLDGDGHILKNLSISTTISNAAALFGCSFGIIKNIALDNITVDIDSIVADSKIAALVAHNNGTLENIAAYSGLIKIGNHSGTLTSYVGGIVSYNEGVLKSITNGFNVSGGNYTAGICAYDLPSYSTKPGEYLINKGTITGTTVAGGVYGYSKQRIFNCMKNIGNVTAANNVGGIIGINTDNYDQLQIKCCVNTGNITSTNNQNGESYAGGLTSKSRWVSVTDSYNTGLISGYYKGGLVGDTGEGAYVRCLNASTIDYGFSRYMGTYSTIQDSITFGEQFATGHATITNSYTAAPTDNSFYTRTLFWSEEVWNIPEKGTPSLVWETDNA